MTAVREAPRFGSCWADRRGKSSDWRHRPPRCFTNLTNSARFTTLGDMHAPRSKPTKAGHRSSVVLVAARSKAKVKPVAIAVAAETLRTAASRPRAMKALIEGYGAAVERTRSSGKPVRFVVEVDPSGAPRITEAVPLPEPETRLTPALATARERGKHLVAEIISRPDMLSADAFAELIGTTRMTVNSKRRSRQVLGLEGAKRGYRFPDWQVGPDGKPFAALPQLFERLGGSPWAVYRFLVQHHPELGGRTAREALRQGNMKAVVEAAENAARGNFG